MRLISATLRCYRLHRELKVEFDSARTLIGGPNESGKSSLVEAIHRALFLKAKGNTEIHREMASTLFPGNAEVELTFEAEGQTHHLLKRFGGSGTTTLSSSGGTPLSADPAEAELARLLGVEHGASGKAVLAQWAHLWVWQGEAGRDPAEHATNRQADLLRRLQDQGAAGALQSELDARVAAQISDTLSEVYTTKGNPKAGSDLERLERELAAAGDQLTDAEARFQRLVDAASDLESAERQSKDIKTSLAELAKNKEELEARDRKLIGLRQTETEQFHAAELAAAEQAKIKATNKGIIKMRAEIAQLEDALTPRRKELAELESTRSNARLAAEKAETEYRGANETVRLGRLAVDLADAHIRRFNSESDKQRLTGRLKRVVKLREELTQLETERAETPELSPAKLKKIRKHESSVAEAGAALNAMAAGLEVLAGDAPVNAGDKLASVGERLILTEDTEIQIGETSRIRITPGGGSSLAQARQSVETATECLRESLDGLGLNSVQEAANALARREELDSRIKAVNAGLDGMDADKLDAEIARATQDFASAKADASRLQKLVPDLEPPADIDIAREFENDSRRRLGDAEESESQTKARRDNTAAEQATLESTLADKREALDSDARAFDEKKAQEKLLVQTHGGDEARTQALIAAAAAAKGATATLQQTKTAIAALQPDLLDADRDRIQRSLETKTTELGDLRERMTTARALLRSDGNDDPQAAAALTRERVRSTTIQRDAVKRKADALALLDRLFREERRDLAEQFTRPLAEKISGYLQRLFGPGASARIELENNQFSGLTLARPGAAGGAFAFSSLSGGAREQCAGAVRLAMAEVLAEDHDGCLPVVFDDAFAYSDPERVNQLQRMLDLGAARGLQIIVLSCNPADYARLGARQITLRPAQIENQPAHLPSI
ncbi:MAG: AAA family ATPase [Verrucomicrobiia bacterium]|jgi:DNA repair exonuclease SbcCD ATPase subunit